MLIVKMDLFLHNPILTKPDSKVHKVVFFTCYIILSVHEHIKCSRIFGRAIPATSKTLTHLQWPLLKPPPPPPASPPHSRFPIPLTKHRWLWAPFRMKSKLEGGERAQHENKWKRAHLLSYREGMEESCKNNVVKTNPQSLYLQINFIWIKKKLL